MNFSYFNMSPHQKELYFEQIGAYNFFPEFNNKFVVDTFSQKSQNCSNEILEKCSSESSQSRKSQVS